MLLTRYHRYHGKCLKIARGKVKEYDSYTCPICDWRVKIPRDAARPKLEYLIDWHAEIAELPFQPEEEELLETIIEQATAFREFLRPFTNATCMTAEEVPTQLFYLRKIEGAEVLLAFETNYFRQEIHKWAPVAPEPPPILEQSLSTRKPRPTKTQKMMAQYGVEKPEDLPLHLRTKQHTFGTKRKSTEPHASRLPPIQPAAGTPSNTPPGDFRRPSTGNGPTLAPTSDTQSPRYAYSHPYPLSATESNSTFGAGPTTFASQDNNVHSPTFPPSSPGVRHSVLDQSLFSPPRFDRSQQIEHNARIDKDNTAMVADVDHQNPFGSSPRGNMDDIFADLTNQDAEAGLEMSHANEALEILKSASNSGSRENSGSAMDGTNGDHDDIHRDENASNALADEFLS